MRQRIMVEQAQWSKTAHFMVAGKHRGKWRGQGCNIPSKDIFPMMCFIQLGPFHRLSIMPLNCVSISRLIHWWAQSSHDPITFQRPHLWALETHEPLGEIPNSNYSRKQCKRCMMKQLSSFSIAVCQEYTLRCERRHDNKNKDQGPICCQIEWKWIAAIKMKLIIVSI